jgi:hypothetical protein
MDEIGQVLPRRLRDDGVRHRRSQLVEGHETTGPRGRT